jgi:hypothetical protein
MGECVPRSAQKRGQKQSSAEMNDRRRSERGTGLLRTQRRPVGNQRHHDELQSDQGTCRRCDDEVEAVPFGQLWHESAHSANRSKPYFSSGTRVSARFPATPVDRGGAPTAACSGRWARGGIHWLDLRARNADRRARRAQGETVKSALAARGLGTAKRGALKERIARAGTRLASERPIARRHSERRASCLNSLRASPAGWSSAERSHFTRPSARAATYASGPPFCLR